MCVFLLKVLLNKGLMADGRTVNTRSSAVLRSEFGTRAMEQRTQASLVNPDLMEQGKSGDGAFLHGNL